MGWIVNQRDKRFDPVAGFQRGDSGYGQPDKYLKGLLNTH